MTLGWVIFIVMVDGFLSWPSFTMHVGTLLLECADLTWNSLSFFLFLMPSIRGNFSWLKCVKGFSCLDMCIEELYLLTLSNSLRECVWFCFSFLTSPGF